jgi:hypothetical protein
MKSTTVNLKIQKTVNGHAGADRRMSSQTCPTYYQIRADGTPPYGGTRGRAPDPPPPDINRAALVPPPQQVAYIARGAPARTHVA